MESKSQIAIFQIYYDEKSEQNLDADFIHYKNEVKGQFFENAVMNQLYQGLVNPPEYIGVTSWRMNSKTNLTGRELMDHMEAYINTEEGKDVYIYCPLNGVEPEYDFTVDPPMLHATIKSHDIWAGHKKRGEPFVIDQALNNSGVLPFDLFDGKWQYCYNNFWVAKWNVFEEYCKTVLIPAMDFLSTQDFPKTYKHSSGKSYSHACFTLEGLFGAFLAHSNYTFDYIYKQKRKRKFHKIKIDGYKIINEL